MKKIRNLTIGGIQQKIYNLVLTTIILIDVPLLVMPEKMIYT